MRLSAVASVSRNRVGLPAPARACSPSSCARGNVRTTCDRPQKKTGTLMTQCPNCHFAWAAMSLRSLQCPAWKGVRQTKPRSGTLFGTCSAGGGWQCQRKGAQRLAGDSAMLPSTSGDYPSLAACHCDVSPDQNPPGGTIRSTHARNVVSHADRIRTATNSTVDVQNLTRHTPFRLPLSTKQPRCRSVTSASLRPRWKWLAERREQRKLRRLRMPRL